MSLKIGIIGAGWISSPHASGWRALGEAVEVVAVADIDEAAGQKLAAAFGARSYTDYRAMLAQEELDAVDIIVPPHLHVEIITAAAAAGVHILCEKPLARDLVEADEIGRALSRSGVTFMPAHHSIFYPSVQRARSYLAGGNLGRIYYLRSQECYTDVPPQRWGTKEVVVDSALKGNAWRASRKLLQGGALIDGGFHAVYRLLYLVGEMPVAVSAMMGLFHPGLDWETEDTAVVLVQFANGAIGNVVISYAFAPPGLGADRLFVATGREGMLAGNEHSLYWQPAGWDQAAHQELSPLRGDRASDAAIAAEIAHFVACLLEKKQPIQSFAEARLALQVVRAAYEAVERGVTVGLE